MKGYRLFLFIGILIQQINCAFWNEIPQRCIYDRTTLFSCWNTTFTKPIPLFNDLSYTLQHHNVQIRDSYFELTLNDLFVNVGQNIEYLILTNNTFSSSSSLSSNESTKLYFRLVQYLEIHDENGIQWSQLNTSYFPQLIKLDLSYNQFTNEKLFFFDQQYFPMLKSLNFSRNQLKTIDNLKGNMLNRIEILIISSNPLETIFNKIHEFQSLVYLDLSFTFIKQLFSLTLLPRLETFSCRQCEQIPMIEYEKFFLNCSHNLNLDLSSTNINSLKIFNPSIKCFKDLTLTNQRIIDSITTNDFLLSTNLENIQLQMIESLNSINLIIYDRLKSIDFSNNIDLKQVNLHLMSDYTYLQRLIISHTDLKDFSINFNHTKRKYIHIDLIDLSYNQIESLDFLQYLTFYSLDLSFNQLKTIDINLIHYRNGIYELFFMNLLNLSSNRLESVKIHWENQSPHIIDLSLNNLQTIELHGQTTYTLLLNNNTDLLLTPDKFLIDLPLLVYLNLNTIHLDSLENLIYLHNLTNIRTLLLDHNDLNAKARVLNWNIFYPWHKNLTHISLKNMSIEKIDQGVYLNDYYHLLTIDLFDNSIQCNCILQPFIRWLKVPPPPLLDFYEPLNKVFSINCPLTLFDMQCDENGKIDSVLIISISISGIILIFGLIILKIVYGYVKHKRSDPYHRMNIENDVIPLDETNLNGKFENNNHQ